MTASDRYSSPLAERYASSAMLALETAAPPFTGVIVAELP